MTNQTGMQTELEMKFYFGSSQVAITVTVNQKKELSISARDDVVQVPLVSIWKRA